MFCTPCKLAQQLFTLLAAKGDWINAARGDICTSLLRAIAAVRRAQGEQDQDPVTVEELEEFAQWMGQVPREGG